MREYKVVTNKETETKRIGEKLASFLKGGDVITLEGDLGAGKTTFVKGIATGLKIERTVSSPTFTIVKEYEGTLPLYHIDAYRLEFSEEDLGLEDYLHGEGVTVVEWAQFIESYLPEERLDIEIKYMENETRELLFRAAGERFDLILDEIFR